MAAFAHSRADLLHSRADPVHSRESFVHSRADLVHSRENLLHSRADLADSRADGVDSRVGRAVFPDDAAETAGAAVLWGRAGFPITAAAALLRRKGEE
jgi:hypothetical protein